MLLSLCEIKINEAIWWFFLVLEEDHLIWMKFLILRVYVRTDMFWNF